MNDMPRKNRISMPQSTAGLVRYFDEYDEALKIKPEHVLAATAGTIILILLIKHGII